MFLTFAVFDGAELKCKDLVAHPTVSKWQTDLSHVAPAEDTDNFAGMQSLGLRFY